MKERSTYEAGNNRYSNQGSRSADGYQRPGGQENRWGQQRQLRNRRLRKRPGRSNTGAARSVQGARGRLRQFRQASLVAVAITSMLLLLFGPEEASGTQAADTTKAAATQADTASALPETVAVIDRVPAKALVPAETTAAAADTAEQEPSARQSTDEALHTLRSLWQNFYAILPKLGIAVLVLLLAAGLSRIIRPLSRKLIGHWERSQALTAIFGIGLWLVAIGIALSVLIGDIRALLGSLGLVGLALSWALQTPIESFTAWLLNSFKGYYRVGDRILVDDVFGDVYRIDFLNTTVWEIGGPGRGTFVQAEQPTGRLVTFPNNEILNGTIINLTADFSYVWDELAMPVANESDLRLAIQVAHGVALQLLGDYMREPARQYASYLQRTGLDPFVAEEPQVFLATSDSWTNVVVRYLVGARERRKWKTELIVALTEALNSPEHSGRIITAYQRQQVQFIRPDGTPAEVPLPPPAVQ